MGYVPIDLKTWHEANKHRPAGWMPPPPRRPPSIKLSPQVPLLLCVWVCACVAVVLWNAAEWFLQ